MSVVTVKINSIDRTSLIDWKTFQFDQALTQQIDTVKFAIKRTPTKTFKPDLNDDIEVFEDAVKVFGGKIVKSNEVIDAGLQTIQLICKDHSHEMDGRLVVDTFESTTIDAIIQSIIDDFLPAGFTLNTTVTNAVEFIAFNFEQPSKVFQQLAELTGGDWFVDENKVIQFFTKNTLTAPFGLSDTGEKYVFNSLRITRDIKNLRNIIFVRGGTFSGDPFVEVQEADGEKDTYDFGFRYKSVTWRVDRGSGFVAEAFGIDNIDDPTTKPWLYNFQEKAMKLGTATRPAAGNRVELGGLPEIPVIIQTRDNVSIGEFGEREQKIIDKSIDTKEAARDRARGELIAWKDKVNEGSFTTRESGLRVGQRIRIQSTIRGLDEFFHISRINTRLEGPGELVHTITLMTQRTFGLIEFLQGQLIDKDKEIEINPDEVLDLIQAALESIDFSEAVATATEHNKQLETINLAELAVDTINAGTCFVYAPFPVPTGIKREGRFGGAVYSDC